MNPKQLRFLIVVIGYIEAERPGVSGGDVRWLKFARWLVNQGHSVTVFSTNNCERLIKKYDSRIDFISAGDLGPLTVGGGLRRLWASLKTLSTVKGKFDHVYSNTVLFYDIVPGLLLKWFRGAKWTAVCHWVPPIFGRQTAFLNSLLFAVGSYVGILLSYFANWVLCVSEPTRERTLPFLFLKNKARIVTVDCGMDMELAREDKIKPSPHAAVHIKRVAKTKGSFDLPVIWKRVVAKYPDAKLTICGDGSEAEIATLISLIDQNGMKEHITYKGPIYDEQEKYDLLHSCRCFVLPSYEENWAIVIGEALASGLEVLCYDLPDIRPVWLDSLHWIPIGDTTAFADRICDIFGGKVTKKNMPAPPALKSWDDVYAHELNLMNQ